VKIIRTFAAEAHVTARTDIVSNLNNCSYMWSATALAEAHSPSMDILMDMIFLRVIIGSLA